MQRSVLSFENCLDNFCSCWRISHSQDWQRETLSNLPNELVWMVGRTETGKDNEEKRIGSCGEL